MIATVLLCVVLVAAVVCVVLILYRRHEERLRCYSAARMLVRSEILDHEILNRTGTTLVAEPTSRRLLLCLCAHTKPKKKYVLDPRRGILFGRDTQSCDVLLSEAVISEQQCRIGEYQGAIWLTDLGSANGTVLRKGLFRTLKLRGGQSVRLESGDRLILGSIRFDLILFPFDGTMM